MKKLFSIVVAMMLFCAGLTHAAVIPNSSCMPFGCATGNGEFQQMYFSKDFKEEVFIKGLTFDLADVHPAGLPSASTGAFTIALSWLKGDGFPPGNKKATNSQVVFQGSLPTAQSWDKYYIDFVQPYFYDPTTNYNLMMDVTWTGAKAGSNPLLFSVTDQTWSRTASSKGSQAPNHYGLNSELREVPEPGSLSLMGLGLFGVGALVRRKK